MCVLERDTPILIMVLTLRYGQQVGMAGEEAGTPTYSDKCREERKEKSFKRTFP
jgi:hypothetical protein